MESVTHQPFRVNPAPIPGLCLGKVEAQRVFEIKPQESPGAAKESERIRGWAPYGAKRDANGQRRRSPIPAKLSSQEAQRGWSGLDRLDRAWPIVPHISPHLDRRHARRHVDKKTGATAIELDEKTRCVARYQIAQSSKCETGWVALRGTELRDDGDRQVRLVLRPKCGTRRCETCDELIRAHQCARAEGDWRTFFTLTQDRSTTAARAWRRIHAALKTWFRELRRELSIAWREWPLWESKRFEQRRDRITAARDRINGPAKLEYAWCLEAHQDGWPHVHMCLNLWWLDYNFARSLWKRCLDGQRSNVDGQMVWGKDGVCRYLAKYVAKGGLAPEILAIIKGRRAWASTGKLPPVPDNGFVIESEDNGDELGSQVEDRSEWGREEGWVLESGKDNAYAKWWRPHSALSPVEAWSTRRFDDLEEMAPRKPVKKAEPLARWGPELASMLREIGEIRPEG